MGIISVLVVEPDPLRLKGIVTSLAQETGLKVAGTGSDFIEALKESSSPSPPPDVLIINIDHQPMRRMKSWALLRSVLPDVRIVALTKGEEDKMLEAALAAGFSALHPTNVKPDVLCRAVWSAAKGVVDYNPYLLDRIKKSLMQDPREREIRIGELSINVQSGEIGNLTTLAQLTSREKQVIALLGKGKSNRQIALDLKITVRTVEFHVTNILKKLGVSSRVEAGILALWL